jgi:hypothetical protein
MGTNYSPLSTRLCFHTFIFVCGLLNDAGNIRDYMQHLMVGNAQERACGEMVQS